jgi:predicted ThiF/HesA family dinucleotide-utilizing enzyme
VLGEDALEKLGAVVIANAKMTRAPVGHELLGRLEHALAHVHVVVRGVYGMGEQQVKVLHATGI